MKARPLDGRRGTAALIERAQSVLRESRKLLEQRETQLKQLEQFLEQNPEIAHGREVRCLRPQIGALLQSKIHELEARISVIGILKSRTSYANSTRARANAMG